MQVDPARDSYELRSAPLDVSGLLQNLLWSKRTAVLTIEFQADLLDSLAEDPSLHRNRFSRVSLVGHVTSSGTIPRGASPSRKP